MIVETSNQPVPDPVAAALLIVGSGPDRPELRCQAARRSAAARRVPPADVEAVGKLVRGPFEGHVVGDLSHMLRRDPDCVGPRGYRRAARQPVSPQVLDLITAWVQRHWARP